MVFSISVSSSVAAVTILPSASELAMAWKQFGNSTKKLSRLRFIRRRIRALGHVPGGQKLVEHIMPDESTKNVAATESSFRPKRQGDAFKSTRRKDYSAEVLGGHKDDDINDEFWKSLDLGPEQISVYNLEMSKVSLELGL